MEPQPPGLTIDGPSGSGKGTISRAVADRLGWHFLDSGALYRAVGLAASWEGLDFSDAEALGRCAARTDVRFEDRPNDDPLVFVDGAEAIQVSFPRFVGTLRSLGADIEVKR